MSSSASVSTWIGQLRSGNEAGAEALWKRYYSHLVESARSHLAQHLRRGGEEEDIALSAFASFCQSVRAGRFPQLANRLDLWKILLTITIRHAKKWAEQEHRQKRDQRQTIQSADLFSLPEADLDRLSSDAPDPSLVAEVADQVKHLLERLPGEDLRLVAQDLLNGYFAAEIAQRHGCSLRTIERRYQRIRQYWSEEEKNT